MERRVNSEATERSNQSLLSVSLVARTMRRDPAIELCLWDEFRDEALASVMASVFSSKSEVRWMWPCSSSLATIEGLEMRKKDSMNGRHHPAPEPPAMTRRRSEFRSLGRLIPPYGPSICTGVEALALLSAYWWSLAVKPCWWRM